MQRAFGWVEQGGTSVIIPGTQGSGVQRFQQSFRSATVTVYDAGTLDLATIYSDNAGTAKANPFTADSTGFWFFYAISGSYDVKFSGGGISAPFTVADISLGVADTGVPSYTFAGLPASSTLNAGNLARVTDEIGGLWMESGQHWVKVYGAINVADAPYFASPSQTGAFNRAAISQAVVDAIDNNRDVYIPGGLYPIASTPSPDSVANGVVVASYTEAGTSPLKRTRIFGDGPTTILQAASDTMFIVRFSAESCVIEDLTLDGNNRAGVIGIGLVGPDMTAATNESVTFSRFSRLYVRRCATGGMLLKSPGAGLIAYNTIEYCRFTGNTGYGILLDDAPAAIPNASGPNRNLFIGCVINGPGNTGIEIVCGDTNKFIACDFEDIANGVSPNATPTGLKIRATGPVTSRNNEMNVVYGCMFEGNTRDIDNANRRTKVFGCATESAKVNGLSTAGFDVLIGAGDIPSRMNEVVVGAVEQNSNNILLRSAMGAWVLLPAIGVSNDGDVPGFGHLMIQPRSGEFDIVFGTGDPTEERLRMPWDAAGLEWPATAALSTNPNTLDDYEEGVFNVTLTTTGTTFDSVTYDVRNGVYTKIGRLVTFAFRLRTDAITVGGATGDVKISGLPFALDGGVLTPVSIGYVAAFAGDYPTVGMISGSDVLLYYRTAANGGVTPLAIADLDVGADDNEIYISGSYITAS